MKTLKANNYEQAAKELANLDESLVEKVSENIDASDKKHYHVITVRIIDRPGQVKNDTKVNVQKFHKGGFDKIIKRFKNTGADYCIVLHDPSKDGEEVEVTVPAHKLKQTEAQIRAEIEKEAEEKIKQRVAEEIEDYKEQQSEVDDPEDLFSLKEIRAKNQEELLAFAEENEIELSGVTKVRELKKIIVSWVKEKNQELKSDN